MNYLLTALQVISGLFAATLIVTAVSSRNIGISLAAIASGFSVYASYAMNAWWPLFVGFACLHLLRMLGLDPSTRR